MEREISELMLLLDDIYAGIWGSMRTSDESGFYALLDEAGEVADIIRHKPEFEKCEYAETTTKLISSAVRNGNFRFAELLRRDLAYFMHCFLEPSDYHYNSRV